MMMKLICVLAGMLVWATPVLAETYSWIDDNGTYNFTEDYSSVPKKYRSKLDRRGDMGAGTIPQTPASPAAAPGAAPPATAKNSEVGKSQTPDGTFGGRSYDQWKQEFGEREAAMTAIKKRIEEVDALLKKSASDREQTRTLVAERNRAVEQFNELRKKYDQFVEQARKAGIQVNISP
jgi:hypothetical protein